MALGLGVGVCHTQAEDLAGFVAVAGPEWDRHDAARAAVGSYHRRTYADSDTTHLYGRPVPAGTLAKEVAVSGQSFLSTSDVAVPYTRTVGLNPDYYFELVPSGREPKQWVVSKVERVLHDQDLRARHAELVDQQAKANVLTALNYIPLKTLFADPRFAATSVVKDQDLYKVTYRYDLSKGFPYQGVLEIESGTLWLDSRYGYGVRRSITFTKGNGPAVKHEFAHELATDPLGLPYVSRSTQTVNDKPVAIARYEVATEPLPRSQFYLSRFGLPEPDWYVQRASTRRRQYVWIAAGVGAVGLGFLAWRLRRRAA